MMVRRAESFQTRNKCGGDGGQIHVTSTLAWTLSIVRDIQWYSTSGAQKPTRPIRVEHERARCCQAELLRDPDLVRMQPHNEGFLRGPRPHLNAAFVRRLALFLVQRHFGLGARGLTTVLYLAVCAKIDWRSLHIKRGICAVTGVVLAPLWLIGIASKMVRAEAGTDTNWGGPAKWGRCSDAHANKRNVTGETPATDSECSAIQSHRIRPCRLEGGPYLRHSPSCVSSALGLELCDPPFCLDIFRATALLLWILCHLLVLLTPTGFGPVENYTLAHRSEYNSSQPRKDFDDE